MLKAAQAYLHTQVNTTSQGQLLLMLYDGGIKFLKQARGKIEERNYAEKGILISKAMDIIAELDGSLNPEKGGELATNLHNLYFYCNTRLLQANLKLDVGLIDEVVEILSSLREAFAQISGGAAAPQPASPNGDAAKAFGQAAGVTAQTHQPPQAATSAQPAKPQTRPASAKAETSKNNVTPLRQQPPKKAQEPEPAPKATQPQGHEHGHAANESDAPAAKPSGKDAKTPDAAPEKPAETASPKQNRLLAGANIYRKMASQDP